MPVSQPSRPLSSHVRRPRRAPAGPLALVLAAAACASGGGGTEAMRNPAVGAQITTRIQGGSGPAAEIRTVSDRVSGAETRVPAGLDSAFAMLPAVYDALGLPINTVLSDVHTLGVRDARAPRRVARQPLSRFLDCGSAANGTRHADTWAVTLSVLSRVSDAGGAASTVVTQVAASAVPLSVSGSQVPCTSTGLLEQAVNDELLARARR